MLWTKIKAAVAVGFMAAATTGTGVAVSRYAAADDAAKPGAKGGPVEGEKPQPAAKAEPAKPDAEAERKRLLAEELAKLKGTWVFESGTLDGRPSEYKDLDAAQITFDGVRLFRASVQMHDDKGVPVSLGYSGKCRLDPSQTPKRISLALDSTAANTDWPVIESVYELAGDVLKVATFDDGNSGAAPRGFAPADQPKGSPRLSVSTFRRAKPAAEPKPADPDDRKRLEAADSARLKGTWRLKSVTAGGLAAREADYKGTQLAFDGAGGLEVTYPIDRGGSPAFVVFKTPYLLDPSHAPKRFAAVLSGMTIGGDWPVMGGIYELDGDTLRVAAFKGSDEWGRHPAGFPPAGKQKGGPEVMVGTFERVADKPEPKPVAAAERERLDAAELAKLKGKWALKSATAGGEAVTQFTVSETFLTFDAAGAGQGETEVVKTGPLWKFDGRGAANVRDQLAKVGPARAIYKVRCRVDSSRYPQRLTATLDYPGGDKLSPAKLIYELDGDTLKLAKLGALDEEADFPAGFKLTGQPKGSAELIVATFQRVKPAEAKPAAVPDRVKELRRERVALLKKHVIEVESIYRLSGNISPHEFEAATRKLCRAELEFAETAAERVKPLEKLLELAVQEEKRAAQLHAGGKRTAQDVDAAKAERLAAEIELELEKARGK